MTLGVTLAATLPLGEVEALLLLELVDVAEPLAEPLTLAATLGLPLDEAEMQTQS